RRVPGRPAIAVARVVISWAGVLSGLPSALGRGRRALRGVPRRALEPDPDHPGAAAAPQRLPDAGGADRSLGAPSLARSAHADRAPGRGPGARDPRALGVAPPRAHHARRRRLDAARSRL